MTNDAITIIGYMMQFGWRLLTCCYLPGTSITPAAMLAFGTLTFIAIKFMTSLFSTGYLDTRSIDEMQLRSGRHASRQISRTDIRSHSKHNR